MSTVTPPLTIRPRSTTIRRRLRGEQSQLFVDGLFGLRRVTYDRSAQPSDADEAAGAEGANVGRATLLNALVSPSLWLGLRCQPQLKLAAGVFTPFGGPISWDERAAFRNSPYPGPVDGVTRFPCHRGSFDHQLRLASAPRTAWGERAAARVAAST